MNLVEYISSDLPHKVDPDWTYKLKDALNSCDAFLVETVNWSGHFEAIRWRLIDNR